jgi:hypothetical protein
LPGCRVVEYDFRFDEVPPDFESFMTQCPHAAMASDADVAWFGFEGSFSFAHLLTSDIANQIYGVIDRDGVALASDATLHSVAWPTESFAPETC